MQWFRDLVDCEMTWMDLTLILLLGSFGKNYDMQRYALIFVNPSLWLEVTIQCAKAVYQFIYYIQFAIIDFVLKSIMFMYLVRVPSSVSFSIFQILYPSFRCKILIPSFVCLFFFFFFVVENSLTIPIHLHLLSSDSIV